MSTKEQRKEYYKQYYEKHHQRLLQARREKLKSDPEFKKKFMNITQSGGRKTKKDSVSPEDKEGLLTSPMWLRL